MQMYIQASFILAAVHEIFTTFAQIISAGNSLYRLFSFI
jgi:hypothetical protein